MPTVPNPDESPPSPYSIFECLGLHPTNFTVVLRASATFVTVAVSAPANLTLVAMLCPLSFCLSRHNSPSSVHYASHLSLRLTPYTPP